MGAIALRTCVFVRTCLVALLIRRRSMGSACHEEKRRRVDRLMLASLFPFYRCDLGNIVGATA
jgi:hypothetical protein